MQPCLSLLYISNFAPSYVALIIATSFPGSIVDTLPIDAVESLLDIDEEKAKRRSGSRAEISLPSVHSAFEMFFNAFYDNFSYYTACEYSILAFETGSLLPLFGKDLKFRWDSWSCDEHLNSGCVKPSGYIPFELSLLFERKSASACCVTDNFTYKNFQLSTRC